MSEIFSDEQRRLNNARVRAVNQAKRDEIALIREGKGTRDWSVKQQREWLQTGKCKGIKGHHMKDVSTYPEYADDKNNIQLLDKKEHLAAHKGNYRNTTNGYYNPNTGRIKDFGENPPAKPKSQALSNPLSERAVKYNETKRKTAMAQKAEIKETKAADKLNNNVKAKTPGKYTDEKTDSKTLARSRQNISSAQSSSTQSKTLSRERAKASDTNKHTATTGKTNTHTNSHKHTHSH